MFCIHLRSEDLRQTLRCRDLHHEWSNPDTILIVFSALLWSVTLVSDVLSRQPRIGLGLSPSCAAGGGVPRAINTPNIKTGT